MTASALTVLCTLVVTFALYGWDRWRYDLVSLAALLFLTVMGIIPIQETFLGFGHPAVVTVVAVLILSKGLQNSGTLDSLAGLVDWVGKSVSLQLLVLCSVTACLSAFINNVGALAVIIPVALTTARKQEASPSLYLMPIAFSSLLGGLTTLIGTPPNIIVSGFRSKALGEDFQLFDYAAVGLPTALAGILLLSLVMWRILPLRKKARSEGDTYDLGGYTTEVRVPAESKVVGQSFEDLQQLVDGELLLLVVVNDQGRRESVRQKRKLKAKDVLVIEGPSESIERLLEKTDLEIAANQELDEAMASEALLLGEAVVMADSPLVGRMPRAKTLRRRFAVALLAVARQGEKLRVRFSQMKLKSGDVLLLRGEEEDLEEMIRETRCLPLARREIWVGFSQPSLLALATFLASIGLVLFRILPAQLAFAIGAVGMVGLRIVPVRTVYQQVDWSIVILLGALLPVGQALETSGAAQFVVENLMKVGSSLSAEVMLAALLVAVMFLSDLVNNAAAAAMSAPIALRMAAAYEVSPDPFLMAVAIGSSCAFLTPIGHQSNTLVMGPGGYRFGDYWKVGLPLEGLIVVVSVPALLYFWPL